MECSLDTIRHMRLNDNQKQMLYQAFGKYGLTPQQFEIFEDDYEICFEHKVESSYCFQIRGSIYNAAFADVYCEPYTYLPHYYKGCDTFSECLTLANDWAKVVSYSLQGKKYFSKIFISHSSKDSYILDKFVSLILKQACGYESKEIVYTSNQSTGVEPGDSIPLFIKNSMNTSDLVVFMISENYKKSEVCLNEMGAAWALEKKTIPILLPNIGFTEIGWLQTFNKAIKINDSESLDIFFQLLNRGRTDVAEWNKIKSEFIEFCSSACKMKGVSSELCQ